MKRAIPPDAQNFSAWRSGAWLHALGWLALFTVLHMRLDISALSTVCLTLVLAEVLSTATLSGIESQDPLRDWQDPLGHVLCRWMAISFLIIVAPVVWPAPFYQAQPLAVVCLIALTLVLAMLKLFDPTTNQKSGHGWRMLHLRMLLGAMLLLALSNLGPLHADIALLGLVLANLILLILPTVRALPTLRNTEGQPINSCQSLISLAPQLGRNLDLMIVPFLFQPQPALLYLVTRGFVQIVPLAIRQLLSLAYPGLLLTRRTKAGIGFKQMAARVNLALLLVGGAAALITMACFEIVQNWPIGTSIASAGLFSWLLIGACAPVLFGATQLLASVVQMRRDAALVHLAGVVVFCTILKGANIVTPVEFARMFAVLQLMTSATLAGLLAYREGIWPGLTALLFRQIRLLGH